MVVIWPCIKAMPAYGGFDVDLTVLALPDTNKTNENAAFEIKRGLHEDSLIMREEINQFYQDYNAKSKGKKAKSGSASKKRVEVLVNGDLAKTTKEYDPTEINRIPMWGEADIGFELKQQIKNNEELLSAYKSQLKWAKRYNNVQIEELMRSKIKQTEKRISGLKKSLRRYK
jgi:hypothetical protein